MATYTLPELRYDFSALEPHISARIMELHHDKHHAAYVKGANTALERLAEARDKGRFDDIGALEKALAFHLSGHILHSAFWQNMAPKAGGRPHGELASAITEEFGSFEPSGYAVMNPPAVAWVTLRYSVTAAAESNETELVLIVTVPPAGTATLLRTS